VEIQEKPKIPPFWAVYIFGTYYGKTVKEFL